MSGDGMTESSDPPPIVGCFNFGDIMGFRRINAGSYEASFETTLGPEHLNRHGTVHGGVVMALWDAAGCSEADDQEKIPMEFLQQE